MTPPVFLVATLPSSDQYVLDGPEGHHAATVRRLRPGEPVRLSDGYGGLAECTVAGAEHDRLTLAVVRRTVLEPPRPRLVVVQALAKGDRGELAVELLTELGADEIVPWEAARAVVQWRGERGGRALARWRSTAREAAKQSRRAFLPHVAELHSTAAVGALVGRVVAEGGAAVVLSGEAGTPLAAVPLPAGEGELVLVVGPEGGLTEGELAAFCAAGARAARLGPTVLRTSTAGAAALAALAARTGRWT
ncbi:MAG TPA: 16S rRNA (uracil(1498)-N(3))-methyltransferase [Mycobacteriales bacterium]|nr:16S rRNA (uracil(1498)-N(3))-methyltransferase [Mycobacteriales bacterium]